MTCRCCGRLAAKWDLKVEGGVMHPECWNEHHSDPSGPWPSGHVCVNREEIR